MDRLKVSMDVLRRLAKEANDPNCVVLAEREINDYLKPEIDALKAAIERVGKAIDERPQRVREKIGASWWVTFSRVVRSCLARSKNGRRSDPSLKSRFAASAPRLIWTSSFRPNGSAAQPT